jgi:hypothetical protein
VTAQLDGEQRSPLRRARLRKGWKQAAAMIRFAEAVQRHGGYLPSAESLRRQFAYWERGDRIPTLAHYRRAFMEIYEAPAEALGFAGTSGSEADDAFTERGPAASFGPYHVDQGLVDLFESQTQNLRLLDRRLGAEALGAQLNAHVDQLTTALSRSIGGRRDSLATCLAEAAALAGWQALDRMDLGRAWEMHELARSASREADDTCVTAHVMAQQSCILLDDQQAALAVRLATAARQLAKGKAPALLQAWLAAAEAEALAATGNELATLRMMEIATRLLDRTVDDQHQLPYLMLTTWHLARWRGHCLARLGREDAIESLTAALVTAGDSVRAATGLHADLVLALKRSRRVDEAIHHAVVAADLARRYGSARQRRRLSEILATPDCQAIKQTDERAGIPHLTVRNQL